MTDDYVDDLVARASKVSDADLRSPAMRAAMRAAMEDLVHMPDGSDPDTSHRPTDSSYVPLTSQRARRVQRRALAAVAAAVLVATVTAGFVLASDDDGGPRDMDKAGTTTTETEPPPPSQSTTIPPDTLITCPRPGQDPIYKSATTSTTLPGGSDLSASTSEPGAPPTTGQAPHWVTPDGEPTGPPTGDCPLQFPGPDGERTPPDESEAPPADAPLPERIVFAFRVAYLGSIERTFTVDSRYGGTTDEMWRDDRSGTWRTRTTGGTGSLAGKPSRDDGPYGFDGDTPTGRRTVDHCFSEYMESNLYGPRNNVTVPVGTARDFDSGVLVVEGNETVDGREAIRLRYTDRDGSIWLDATTLLPFRTSGTFEDGGSYTTTVEFLPRTAENRRLLEPEIPAGYTLVDQPRGDGASQDAGCSEL
jgi:hypothetical protein